MNQVSSRYSIQESRLTVGDSEILFNFPIAQAIEVDDMLIVRLEVPVKVTYNENVLGVSIADQKIKWQIEKREYNARLASCPFTYIRIFEGELELINWCDTYFVVDPYTGGILREGWSK